MPRAKLLFLGAITALVLLQAWIVVRRTLGVAPHQEIPLLDGKPRLFYKLLLLALPSLALLGRLNCIDSRSDLSSPSCRNPSETSRLPVGELSCRRITKHGLSTLTPPILEGDDMHHQRSG